MALRIVLLIVLVGGLFIFVQSNGLPVQLTFLGIQTPAIPLGIWILAAIGAGILTSLVLNGLFHLTNRSGQQQARARFRRSSSDSSFQPDPSSPFDRFRSDRAPNRSSRATEADDDADWRNWEGYEDRADRQQTVRNTAQTEAPPKATQPQEAIDDWERSNTDDWDDFEDTPRPDAGNSPPQPRTNDETRQEPSTTSRSGSVYSYGYRDPRNSGAGRVEPVSHARNPDEPEGNRSRSVVDAEYRVIVPPYNPVEPEPVEPVDNAEDWFDEDDDLETDEERQRRTGF